MKTRHLMLRGHGNRRASSTRSSKNDFDEFQNGEGVGQLRHRIARCLESPGQGVMP